MREREIIEREREEGKRERYNQRYISTKATQLALFPFVLLFFILVLRFLFAQLQRGRAPNALIILGDAICDAFHYIGGHSFRLRLGPSSVARVPCCWGSLLD